MNTRNSVTITIDVDGKRYGVTQETSDLVFDADGVARLVRNTLLMHAFKENA